MSANIEVSQLLNLLKLKKSNVVNICVELGECGSIDKDLTLLHLHLKVTNCPSDSWYVIHKV